MFGNLKSVAIKNQGKMSLAGSFVGLQRGRFSSPRAGSSTGLQNGTSEWRLAPACLRIETGLVHVWRAYLPEARAHLVFFMRTLSPDEQSRAERFVRHDDTVSFALRRGILRCILSRYADARPQDLRFEYSPLGKPWLCPASDAPALNFSVSHSKEWALIAVGRDRDVGIDVEHVRSDLNVLSIAGRFFSKEESDFIESAPDGQRQRLFFDLWARKEAYVKALGRGLSMPLDRFVVPVRSHAFVRLHPGEEPWLFDPVPLGPDYASALATHPPATHIQRYHWRNAEDGSAVQCPKSEVQGPNPEG